LRPILFHIFWGLLLLAIHPQTGAQIIPPAHPEIVSASVDTATGLVNIVWRESSTFDIEKYTMFYDTTDRFGQTSWFPTFDTVDRDTRQYSYSMVDAGKSARSFTVQAVDSAGNSSNFNDWHTTMHLRTEYDSCNKQMHLDWTSYNGWEDDLVKYEVYYSINNGPFAILFANGTQDTTEVHIDILENRNYCYFIKAVNPSPSVYSFSNKVCRYVSHPLHPAWINAESASAVGSDQVEVKFAMDPAGEVTRYQLMKAAGPDKPFTDSVTVIGDAGDTLSYIDNVLSTEKQFQYKLYSLDVCDNITTESNICGNIVLSAVSKGLLVDLSWTPYSDYEAGVEYYQVLRSVNKSVPEPVNPTISFPDTSFQDDLSDFTSTEIEDEVCYYVEAVENINYTRGERGSSRSQRACVSIVPEIFMANAFIPNANIEENRKIKPALTFIPEDYLFIVFDRWGSRIFETTDSEEYWDGRVNGGGMAPEGVYVYYIRLTTASGIEVDKKGEITLFYR
jgi:hypothetical protein